MSDETRIEFHGAPGENGEGIVGVEVDTEVEAAVEEAGLISTPLAQQEWWQEHLRKEAELNAQFAPLMEQIRTCIGVAVDEGHTRISFEGSEHEDVYVDGRTLVVRMYDGTFVKLSAKVEEVFDIDYRKRLDELAAGHNHDMGDWDWMYQTRRYVSMCRKCGATNTMAEQARGDDPQIKPVWTRLAANMNCGDMYT